MTEAASPASNEPEGKPIDSGPGDSPGPGPAESVVDPEPPSSTDKAVERTATRLAPEFWLALAGILATVIAGVTASTLAYRTAGNQVKAEADRVTVQFTKEQRKSAYVDFLDAYTDLSENEFELTHQLARTDDFNMDAVLDKDKAFAAQYGKCRSTSAAVELLASLPVDKARGDLVEKHNDILNLVQPLALAIAKAGDPRKFAGKVAELQSVVDAVRRDDSRLRSNFINAAKKDLGLVN